MTIFGPSSWPFLNRTCHISLNIHFSLLNPIKLPLKFINLVFASSNKNIFWVTEPPKWPLALSNILEIPMLWQQNKSTFRRTVLTSKQHSASGEQSLHHNNTLLQENCPYITTAICFRRTVLKSQQQSASGEQSLHHNSTLLQENSP